MWDEWMDGVDGNPSEEAKSIVVREKPVYF
jgi:hypothetical protein